MRALALVCLGITILTPGAGAETRTNSPKPTPTTMIRTGSTNLSATTVGVPYAIIANSGDRMTRSFAVQLERRLGESDLKRVATDIRLIDMGGNTASAVVMFYLPGMKLGHGVWAHAYFPATDGPDNGATVEPKISIVGLTVAEEDRLVLSARRDSRNLVGAWLTATPAPVGKLTLYREKGHLYAEWGLRDGTRFAEEVIENALPEGGWRYDRRDGGAGEHMRMTTEGELELRDRNDVITATQSIKRQPGDFNLAVAKSNQNREADAKLSQGKAQSSQHAADQVETKKLNIATSRGTIVTTTIGSATTTAGSGDKLAKTKTALPVEPTADPDALANVIFR